MFALLSSVGFEVFVSQRGGWRIIGEIGVVCLLVARMCLYGPIELLSYSEFILATKLILLAAKDMSFDLAVTRDGVTGKFLPAA